MNSTRSNTLTWGAPEATGDPSAGTMTWGHHSIYLAWGSSSQTSPHRGRLASTSCFQCLLFKGTPSTAPHKSVKQRPFKFPPCTHETCHHSYSAKSSRSNTPRSTKSYFPHAGSCTCTPKKGTPCKEKGGPAFSGLGGPRGAGAASRLGGPVSVTPYNRDASSAVQHLVPTFPLPFPKYS